MKREVTRAELIKALSLIGIELASGKIEGKSRDGRHFRMNGESNESYVCLIVEEKENV